jgi:hypothetical protein
MAEVREWTTVKLADGSIGIVYRVSKEKQSALVALSKPSKKYRPFIKGHLDDAVSVSFRDIVSVI